MRFYCICVVVLQVSWLRRADDGMRLLSYDKQAYISDGRYQMEFREPNDWQLRIRYANERDEGHYECQVSSHPPVVSRVYLKIQGTYTSAMVLNLDLKSIRQRYGRMGSFRKISPGQNINGAPLWLQNPKYFGSGGMRRIINLFFNDFI